jgi:nicotinate-nucleotide--dimethylbenzimidazole phosphoribosyltransferase
LSAPVDRDDAPAGAGVAILLLRAALACHNGMATFSEAGVSDRDG